MLIPFIFRQLTLDVNFLPIAWKRGGSWDNSDVKGAKQKRWLSSDKSYAAGGYKKEQSKSIFGYGEGLDWSGNKKKTGPGEVSVKSKSLGKNYKVPNIYDDDKPKKKFFGLF